MKQLVDIIKSQIQQLKIPVLRDWLLNHLKDNTNSLTEVFSKQIPVHLKQTMLPIPANTRLPPHLVIFPIIYAYAPEQLRLQLTEKLQTFPQLMDERELIDNREMHTQFFDELNDFKDAWPIIKALQEQGANELIQVLDKADEHSLKALARLNKDSDFSVLLSTFLVKNSKDLEQTNRNRLIQFLRQPDFTGWFSRYLDSFIKRSTEIMSLRLLFLTYSPAANELDKVAELRACIDAYPFPIHIETMWVICNYYQTQLQQNLYSTTSNSFILLLHDVLKKMSLTTQIQFVKGLNPELYLLIVDFCLNRCVKGPLEEQQIYMNLLYLFCSESVVPNNECHELIKIRLLQQDAYLFESPQLEELAKSVQAKSKETLDPVFGGSWIKQLITSPSFVAACSSHILKHLTERYSLFCLTLNAVDYSKLISSFNTNELQEHLQRINLKLGISTEENEVVLAKQFKLLKIGIERHVSALLFQLEEQCNQLSQDQSTTQKALQTLYSYYGLIYPSLRFDLLVRAIDSNYQEDIDSNFVDNEQKQVLQRFKSSCSSLTETASELQRKKEVCLYNSAGQKIGFVKESNEAITFVEDEPVLLSATSVQDNEPVYDETCKLIGYLTESGQFKSKDGIQKELCARILAMTPEIELEKSSSGLELLIQNVLFENTLDVLYGCSDGTESSGKHQWLERRIAASLQGLQRTIHSTTINSLISNFSDEGTFYSLAVTQHKANAIQIFHSILNHDKKRELLFSGLYEADFHQFLDRHNVVFCLAEYMAKHYDKPWFAEGLSRFAYYGKKHRIDNMLSDSLDLLFKNSCQCKSDVTRFDALIKQFIDSETCAALVLKEFLNDRGNTREQEMNNPEIDRVAQFFYKKHIVDVIQKLNKTSFWGSTAQYALLLYILDRRHSALFAMSEVNLPSQEAWKSNELNQLARFINRHLGKKRPLDKEHSIGHRILGELLFRCAHLGQTSLFYSKHKFNSSLARLSLTRSFLEKLVDKFWIPEGIKEQVTDEVSRLKEWFQDNTFGKKELKDNQILLDWRHLMLQTWKEINRKKLPMICAYLLNYTGQKNHVLLLLQDYLSSFQNNTEYLHPVSRLLQQFPQRDVSFVIFDALEAAIIKNPQIMDITILRDMAQFYAKKIMKQELGSPEAELCLLSYFGQHKHYTVVQQGCEELSKNCTNKETKKRLIKGATEARVEESLQQSIEKFYFGLIKIIKRLWYYGFNAEKNASKLVTFCDDNSSVPTRKQALDEVKIPSASMNSEYLGFNVKRKQLIGLLDAVKRSSVIKTFDVHPSKTKQTLFGCSQSSAPSVREHVVASQQGVITRVT